MKNEFLFHLLYTHPTLLSPRYGYFDAKVAQIAKLSAAELNKYNFHATFRPSDPPAGLTFCLPPSRLDAALEDAASAEEPFVRVCREVLGKRGCGRKRKPSAKIFESINKMLGQIVLQKQP